MLKLKGGVNSGEKGASFHRSRQETESAFSSEEYERFDAVLRDETQLARSWGAGGNYAPISTLSLGCEIESCLSSQDGAPVPESANFLEYLSSDEGYYEMTKYNVEFEVPPCMLRGNAFAVLHDRLESTYRHAGRCADMIMSYPAMIGILPSFEASHFSADMITDRLHFRTLEKQLRRMNADRPFDVNIGYGDGLRFEADNLSVEGAAASLQVHLSVSEPLSAAFYNAAQMVSALTVAVSANSPFFLGRRLWAETRVPLFEQIMYERFVGYSDKTLPYGRRCDNIFGNRYLDETMLELLSDNYSRLPPILPIVRGTPPEKMLHLILHNRDILRWNRPVLGFFNNKPFLRIEHRVMPSGPTTADMTANIAFFTGLVCHFHRAFTGGTFKTTESRMPFEIARENFYRAAQKGLDAEIEWVGHKYNMREFILERGLEYARRGLRDFGIGAESVDWLDIIKARVETGQNGEMWQRRYAEKHGTDNTAMRQMVGDYLQKQADGTPVHTWGI